MCIRDSCNRVRLTSTGFLKGCLQFEDGADLKVLLRSGCSDGMLKETIEKVIYEKPVGHNFQEHKKGNEESHIMAPVSYTHLFQDDHWLYIWQSI